MFLPEACQVVTPKLRVARTWEPASTQWVLESISRGGTFVDVGAHAGYFTLLAAWCVGPEGRVYAFEPDPVNCAILRKNVELNGFHNVVVEQVALAEAPGHRELYLSTRNSGDHRLAPEEGREAVAVEAVALDDYWRGRGPVDFMKIDTQGSEAAVIAGARRTLSSSPGARILLEFWPFGLARAGAGVAELVRLLEECGFRVAADELRRLGAACTVENRRHRNLRLQRPPRFEVPA
jgi:FkbM family methyltransferase